MLKIKNKFIIFIIIIIITIIIILLYRSFNESKKDLDSYIVLIDGKAQLNTPYLVVQQKYKLSVGDIAKTIGNDALAILEWGDGSVTRLGGNTSIKIDELHISNDLGKMNINFKLLTGRTWSNVISFFGEGSYFKENFRDYEAAVRGTTFDLDIDKDYLYVSNHKVDLTIGSGEVIEVDQHNPLNLKTLSFISLQEYIKSFKDKNWDLLNKNFDNELLNTMKNRFNKDIGSLVNYTNLDLKNILTDESKKQEYYNYLLLYYQKLNFAKPSDGNLFDLKLKLKDNLLQLSTPENKDILLNSTMYDFKEILDSKKYDNLDQLLEILSKNKDYLKNINLNYYFKDSIIPDDIKAKIKNNFSELTDFFTSTFNTFKGIDVTIDDVKNIRDKADGLIHNGLDTLFNK